MEQTEVNPNNPNTYESEEKDLAYSVKIDKIIKGLDYLVTKEMAKKLNYDVATGHRLKSITERRTRVIKQKAFLQYYQKSYGVILTCCEKLNIGRTTFYDWIKDDKWFADAIKVVNDDKNKIAEDILWGKIIHEKDGSCTKYYLDRKHPDYKPKVQSEVFAGDGYGEFKKRLQKEINGNNKQKHNSSITKDKKQEGQTSTVQTERGTEILLGEENEEKPNTKS